MSEIQTDESQLRQGPGVVLLGGGLDSSSLLVWLRRAGVPLDALWVHYGQKAWRGEQAACEWVCRRYGVPLHTVTIELAGVASSAILGGAAVNTANDPSLNKLEARNVVLVSLGAMLAANLGRQVVYVGYHVEPPDAPFPDATDAARAAMSAVMEVACRPPVRVVAPFSHLTREEILRAGLWVEPELAARTFTCYEGEGLEECGTCAHCLRKKEMLRCVESR